MKIGEVAERLGVEVHVLRHWDDVGVVVADRTAAGHRHYTVEHVHRLKVLMRCREVGLSLAEIRGVLHRDEDGRRGIIEGRLALVRKQRGELDAAESFLTHVLECRHGLLTRCPDCSAYAGAAGQRR